MNALGIYSKDGDRLTYIDFRWSVPQDKLHAILHEWLKLREEERRPFYNRDHVTMIIYDTKVGLLLVAFALENVPPLHIMCTLQDLARLFQSLLGGLSEEKVRSNLHMVAEVVCECIDYGVVKAVKSSVIAGRLHSSYLPPKAPHPSLARRPTQYRSTQFRAIMDTNNQGKEEVYLDVIEDFSATVAASGQIVIASCIGTVQMKSYLKRDDLTAMLKMHLFHCTDAAPQYAFMHGRLGYQVFLEDLQLHEDATLHQDVDANGHCQLSATAVKGERVLMTYSVNLAKQGDFRPLLTAGIVVEAAAEYDKKAMVRIRVQNNSPKPCSSVTVEVPVPKFVTSVNCSHTLPRSNGDKSVAPSVHVQSEYDAKCSVLTAKLRNRSLPRGNKPEVLAAHNGSFELTLGCMLKTPFESSSFHRGLGPVNLTYQMHGFLASGMKVCYLDFVEASGAKFTGKDGGPGKWVRYITTSSSTTFRV